MERIVVYDGNGNRLDELVQWDRDVYVYVNNPDVGDAWDVHFFNIQSTEALVVYSTYEDGVLKAKIPNELLRVDIPVVGYIYIEEDDGDRSVYGFRLPIKKRPKPADYIYTDSDDYASISAVLRECLAYATSAAESESDAEKYATLSQSYAVGGTGTRTGEDADNSKYYSEQAESSADDAATSASEAARSAEVAENAVIATDAEAVFELFNDVTLNIENLQNDMDTAEENISDLQSLTSDDVTEADVDALFEE